MSDRAKEIAESAARWAAEAWKAWSESLKASPEAHAYTLIFGAVLAIVARWAL
jgi:hypothetical protein